MNFFDAHAPLEYLICICMSVKSDFSSENHYGFSSSQFVDGLRLVKQETGMLLLSHTHTTQVHNLLSKLLTSMYVMITGVINLENFTLCTYVGANWCQIKPKSKANISKAGNCCKETSWAVFSLKFLRQKQVEVSFFHCIVLLWLYHWKLFMHME